MLKIIGIVLVLWVVVSVVGFLIEGLFWLAVLGVVLFLGTAAYGALTQRSRGQIR